MNIEHARIALLALLAGLGFHAFAQNYPERPIRLIVPQAAGSATDTVARILAAEMPPSIRARTRDRSIKAMNALFVLSDTCSTSEFSRGRSTAVGVPFHAGMLTFS